MSNKTFIKKSNIAPYIALFVLLLLSSFFMFDFYMCLSGFVANKFAQPLVMLPIILSFLAPVLSSLVAIYHLFVRELGRVGRIVLSSVTALASFAVSVLTLVNIPLYVRNNFLGAYSSTLGIFLFPYDTLIVNAAVIALSVFGIITGIKTNIIPPRVKNFATSSTKFKLCIPEYIAFSILAIVVFVFVGAGISGVGSVANALYDVRYVFLLLWVGVVPMLNLAIFVIKPERMKLPKWTRSAILSSTLFVNFLFGFLFLIFELTTPGFIIHIGKPLFMIAFSVSMPIEMIVILGIMVLGTVIISLKLFVLHFVMREPNKPQICEKCDKCASV